MSHDDDPYRGWRWDREDAAANRQALVIEKAGHQVRADHHGLLIDGQHVSSEPLRTSADAPQVLPTGQVVYRGQVVADLSPQQDHPAPAPDRPQQPNREAETAAAAVRQAAALEAERHAHEAEDRRRRREREDRALEQAARRPSHEQPELSRELEITL